jgi:uncharacterized protein
VGAEEMSHLTRRGAVNAMLAGLLMSSRADATAHTPGPPLWVAERRSSKVFLFGQMPVKTDSSWLSGAVQGAFDASTELWLENPDFDPVTMGKTPPPEPPKGPKLSEVAGSKDLARLHRVLLRAGMAADAFDGIPISAVYLPVADLSDRAVGADFSAIPERVLRSRAKAAGKPVHSEWASFDEATRFLTDLPTDEQQQVQLQLFEKGLDEAEDVQAAQKRLTQWLAGDLEGLNALERHFRRAYPLAYRLIGEERNKAWAPRLASVMDRTNTAFVCVGILHLLGPSSIQENLMNSGISVRRI